MFSQRRCRLTFFSPMWSHFNENERKKVKKKKKIKKKLKNNKNVLEIWWIGTCHQNLVPILLMVSDEAMSMDGRTNDGRPRHDCS